MDTFFYHNSSMKTWKFLNLNETIRAVATHLYTKYDQSTLENSLCINESNFLLTLTYSDFIRYSITNKNIDNLTIIKNINSLTELYSYLENYPLLIITLLKTSSEVHKLDELKKAEILSTNIPCWLKKELVFESLEQEIYTQDLNMDEIIQTNKCLIDKKLILLNSESIEDLCEYCDSEIRSLKYSEYILKKLIILRNFKKTSVDIILENLIEKALYMSIHKLHIGEYEKCDQVLVNNFFKSSKSILIDEMITFEDCMLFDLIFENYTLFQTEKDKNKIYTSISKDDLIKIRKKLNK